MSTAREEGGCMSYHAMNLFKRRWDSSEGDLPPRKGKEDEGKNENR